MAQGLLHAEEHRRVILRLGIDHPVGMQPDAGQGGREEIAPGKAPENRAAEARQHPRGKERGGGTMHRAEAIAADLVQRTARQTALRQAFVERRHTEGQNPVPRPPPMLDPSNPCAQLRDAALLHARQLRLRREQTRPAWIKPIHCRLRS